MKAKRATPQRRSAPALDIAGYNAFCSGLPHVTHVVQWGGAHVWKVAGKVFAIGGWNQGEALSVSFKCSPLAFEILKDQPGLRPAPYLASRGFTWIQRFAADAMDDAALCEHIRESHRLVALGLPKKVRHDLGLDLENKGEQKPREDRS